MRDRRSTGGLNANLFFAKLKFYSGGLFICGLKFDFCPESLAKKFRLRFPGHFKELFSTTFSVAFFTQKVSGIFDSCFVTLAMNQNNRVRH